MSLRYTFRHLFYGGKIQKERLYKVLEDLDKANGGESKDINDIKETLATYTPVEVTVTYADESTETLTLLSVVDETTDDS